MTIILTFWLCAISTTCDAAHSVGYHSTFTLPHSTITDCDEINAVTDDKYLDHILSLNRATRYTCVVQGEAL